MQFIYTLYIQESINRGEQAMYNITGWSNGGRRPLSYNLMPGQFRNTRVNVFSNPTIINNNIGGFGGCYDYYDDCCCGGGSNKMSWMDWTMMGGMLLNGLGNMFACFWGGGGGKPDVEEKPKDLSNLRSDVRAYAEMHDNCTKAKVLSNGSILATINGETDTYPDLEAFIEALGTSPSNNDRGSAPSALTDDIKSLLSNLNITIEANGKFKFNGQEYDSWTAAVQAAGTTTMPPAAGGTLTAAQLNEKKAPFAELFNEAYITANFQTTGEHAGKLKVGEKYFDNVTDAYKEYVNSRQNGTGTEVISGINAMSDLATIFDNNNTISVIDDSNIRDLTNKQISNFNATNGTVTIGGRNYSIEIKGNGKYVYLTDTTAGTTNKQVYILEKDNTGKYQISQRQDIAFVDASAGWNKAATS